MTELVKKNGVSFSLIIGVISILSTVTMYAIDVRLLANYWVGICLFIINLVLGIVAVSKTKKGLNGVITFKEAFTVFFIAMAIGAAIGSIFIFILLNLIDPDAKVIIMDRVTEMTVNMMQSMGAKTEDIRKTVEQMKETDSFSLVSQLKSYAGGLIFYIIIGLIVAAAFKTKAKVEY